MSSTFRDRSDRAARGQASFVRLLLAFFVAVALGSDLEPAAASAAAAADSGPAAAAAAVAAQSGGDVAAALQLQAAEGTATAPQAEPHALQHVLLQKQYVPVTKDEKVVAYKTAFFGSIYVNGEEFSVVFDTGSGHVILPSSGCESETCMKHKRYNRTVSDSAVDVDYDGRVVRPGADERDQVNIAFGTGEVLGEFIDEVVCLGAGDRFCVKQRVVLATEMTPDPFGLFAFDGVLGLGLPPLCLDDHFSFFNRMMEEDRRMEPIFGVFLAKFDGGENQLTFGGYAADHTTSELTWAPVADPELGYWQVKVKRIVIGNTVLPDCEDGTCHAILDTGTSLLGVPRMMTRPMHRLLARPVPSEVTEPFGEIDCRRIPGQKVHFDLGDFNVTLHEDDYSRPIPFNMTVPGNESWKLFCRSLLLPVDMEAPLGTKTFIWGEPMLRRYYTVYNMKDKVVGFSPAKDLPEDEEGRGLPPVGAPPQGSLISGSPMVRKQLRGSKASTILE
eukprot:TRINITY_DN65238_c0_g1_i1.p1 TRINITY_DN65238_c0_g1~~TRINITY_DN65238_c0_g1_i1.p1  ORF type:complete len:502 (-),score=113.78 TRINITY_DN65238_c0_g1_i1:230-1735(-)